MIVRHLVRASLQQPDPRTGNHRIHLSKLKIWQGSGNGSRDGMRTRSPPPSQLSSTKRMIEVWSVTACLEFRFSHGYTRATAASDRTCNDQERAGSRGLEPYREGPAFLGRLLRH